MLLYTQSSSKIDVMPSGYTNSLGLRLAVKSALCSVFSWASVSPPALESPPPILARLRVTRSTNQAIGLELPPWIPKSLPPALALWMFNHLSHFRAGACHLFYFWLLGCFLGHLACWGLCHGFCFLFGLEARAFITICFDHEQQLIIVKFLEEVSDGRGVCFG